MNEEEKQAIEYLKARLYGNEGCYLIDVAQSDLRILLNLVENQQKGMKAWEEIYDEEEEDISLKNNKILDLEFKIKEQSKEIEELKERNQTCIKESDLMNAVSFLMNRNDMSNYISKDKIRKLIKEKAMKDTYNFRTIAVKDIEELLRG